MINKAVQFKLKPTRVQEKLFWQYAGAARWGWNTMLADRQQAFDASGKSPSMYEQMRQLTILKQEEATAWLGTIQSQVLQEPVKHLQRAFQNFFEKRAAYPRFKSRKSTHQAFSYPQGVKVDENQVYLPKIGWVRFRKSRAVEGTINAPPSGARQAGGTCPSSVRLTLTPRPSFPRRLARSVLTWVAAFSTSCTGFVRGRLGSP